MACVRTCCSITEVGPVCCNACAGTWTVSALGTEAGFPGWAGIVIWTGTNRSGFVMTNCGALDPAAPLPGEVSLLPLIWDPLDVPTAPVLEVLPPTATVPPKVSKIYQAE